MTFFSALIFPIIQLSAELTFCVQQQQCLSVIQHQIEGDTKKLQNPYPRGCLPWADHELNHAR